MTYAKSGVDIEKEEQAVKELLSSITSTRKGIMRWFYVLMELVAR